MPNFADILSRIGMYKPKPPINQGSWGTSQNLFEMEPEDPMAPTMPERMTIPAPGLPAPPPREVSPVMEEPFPDQDRNTRDAMQRPIDVEPIGIDAMRPRPAYDRFMQLSQEPYAPPKPSKLDAWAALATGAFGGWQAGAGRAHMSDVMGQTRAITERSRNEYLQDRTRKLQEAQAAVAAENALTDDELKSAQIEATREARLAAVKARQEKAKQENEVANRRVDMQASDSAAKWMSKGVVMIPAGTPVMPDQASVLDDENLYRKYPAANGGVTYVSTGKTRIDPALRALVKSALGTDAMPEYATKETLKIVMDAVQDANQETGKWNRLMENLAHAREKLDALTDYRDGQLNIGLIKANAVAKKAETDALVGGARARSLDAGTKARDVDNREAVRARSEWQRESANINANANKRIAALRTAVDSLGKSKYTKAQIDAETAMIEQQRNEELLSSANTLRSILNKPLLRSRQELDAWRDEEGTPAPAAPARPAAGPGQPRRPLAAILAEVKRNNPGASAEQIKKLTADQAKKEGY